MHGPGAPSALPPRGDTIIQRTGRAGRAGRSWLMAAEPRALGAGWRGRQPAECGARPKAPAVPGGQGRGTDRRGGPGAITKFSRVSARFPRGVREARAAPAPLPELCSTRLRKGHCVPGLGSGERLMDPKLGAPRGRGLQSPARDEGGAQSRPPPAEGGVICRTWARSGGKRGGRAAGGGVARDPDQTGAKRVLQVATVGALGKPR